MNVNEKYYRRSYNAINRLIEIYKDGYNQNKTLNFRQELISKYRTNTKIMQSEFNSLMFTAVTALLGLNKESIENTGKIIEYKKNNNEIKLDIEKFNKEEALRLKDFYNSKTVSTDFDNWLSIKKIPEKDKNNIDYLKRIRNSLLHSNFYIDDDVVNLPITKLKTKSYFEADLLNVQFQLFVLEYFANIDFLGLSEALYTFDVPRKQIKDINMLVYYLAALHINKVTYKNLKTVGENSPELLLKEFTNKDGEVDTINFNDKLINNNNIDDLKCETSSLKLDFVYSLSIYIIKTYGTDFFHLDYKDQGAIISTVLKYILNSKTEISNWIIHFWYLYSSINNPKFNVSFFDGDEFGIESCYPALTILKSYMVMYRLQNNDFDEVDYSKIDFDIDDKSIALYSENIDKSLVTENYFKNSFDKEMSKGLISDKKVIWNKIICEVIRDSLAHGNVKTFISMKDFTPMIQFRDVDTKKGTVRCAVFPLDKYEQFLNSEAFSPMNCYNKEDSKILMKSR